MDSKHIIITLAITICTAASLIVALFQGSAIHESDNEVRRARIAGCRSLSDQTAMALCLREVKV